MISNASLFQEVLTHTAKSAVDVGNDVIKTAVALNDPIPGADKVLSNANWFAHDKLALACPTLSVKFLLL